MARVKRANVILDIKESEVQRYLDLGYDVLGEDGKVIKKCIPNTLGELRMAYVEHTAMIAKLQEELKKAQKKTTKATPIVEKKAKED